MHVAFGGSLASVDVSTIGTVEAMFTALREFVMLQKPAGPVSGVRGTVMEAPRKECLTGCLERVPGENTIMKNTLKQLLYWFMLVALKLQFWVSSTRLRTRRTSSFYLSCVLTHR